jgi:hypothetical protein
MPLTKRRVGAAAAVAAAIVAACSSSSSAPPIASTRSYRMGFSDFPPRIDSASYVNALSMWLPRADGGIVQVSPPWKALLAGATPESAVTAIYAANVRLYQTRNMRVFATIDVTDGLNRAAEAPELVAAGRSITEPAIQQIYRHFVVAFDTLLRPDYLGLAAETNLIQAAAPAPVYDAVVTMTNAAAADVRAVDPARKLYVSVQVETAWGRLMNGGVYLGIARDYTDFPFIDAFGLSSYPYLGGFADPADIPEDYLSRLVAGHSTPVMVVEGGWASASGNGFATDPLKQARYFARLRTLLDRAHAIGVFQLTFADLDTAGMQLPPSSVLPLFISLGVVDDHLVPKPALATWDSLFARTLAP